MAASMAILLFAALGVCFKFQALAGEPETVSVVMDNAHVKSRNEFIQILHPPNVIDNRVRLTVEYRCNKERVVGVEILYKREITQPWSLTQRMWKCKRTIQDENSGDLKSKIRKIRLRLPDDVGFRPGIFNPVYSFVFKSTLRAWIVDKRWYSLEKDRSNCFLRAPVKVSYKVTIPPPYSRPAKIPYKACRQWYWEAMTKSPRLNDNQFCPVEEEIVHAIQYPAALNGLTFAVYRKFAPFTDPKLEQTRKAKLTNPQFTVEMWLYFVEFCPERPVHPSACGILMHVQWNNTFLTPLIVVDYEGHPQVELFMAKTHRQVAYKAPWKFPRHQWVKMVFRIDGRKWIFTAQTGKNFNETSQMHHTFLEDIYLDDTEGVFAFGGNDDIIPSFKGYIGRAIVYRVKVVSPEQIPLPNPYHPMFELGLTRREEKCKAFMTWIGNRIEHYKHHVINAINKNKCHNYFREILRNHSNPTLSESCPRRLAPRRRSLKIVNSFIRKSVFQGKPIKQRDLRHVARNVFANATQLIERDVDNVPRAVPLLKQAACLGEYDAMYMLSVILNNGFKVKADEIQAQAYLMLGSLDKHRLSTLALGTKHMYGIDGVPYDPDQSYLYYKYVATKTRDDMELHKDTDVVTESVRLTDENHLLEQTDENGDVFLWLKHQAQQGVVSAQQRVSRALFWGAQGLKRNLNEALEIFRQGAEAKDPSMMYDYGISVYRGHGSKKNKSEGKKFVEKAAEAKHPDAINALGWIAMNEQNYEKAAQLFEKAFHMNQPDSGYYLAHLHLMGYYPGKPVDWDEAYWYYEWAATRGHFDAGVMYAYLNIKGTPKHPRSVYHATQWARFIAEKNPSLGMVLRKGLHAYRRGDMSLALFYYMMAAETGIEVASFNVAWLCEANNHGIVASVEKDCQWRHYNLTVQRELHFVNSYSLIKMGDYHWYGCKNRRDVARAAWMYAQAAGKGDPHALFNLAVMVEDGVQLSDDIIRQLHIPLASRKNNVTVLNHLYSKCKESKKTEAYMPCSLALVRLQVLDVWTRYNLWMKLSTAVGVAVVAWTTIYTIYSHITHRRGTQDLI